MIADYDLSACFNDNDAVILTLASTTEIAGIVAFMLFVMFFCIIAFLAIKGALGIKEFSILLSAIFMFQYLIYLLL